LSLESFRFWEAITALGAAKLALPFLALLLLILVVRGQFAGALAWGLGVAGCAAVDFGWKVAYRAAGIGFPRFDFTAPSGHALLAAAIYPVFFGWLYARGGTYAPEAGLHPAAAATVRPHSRAGRRLAATFAALGEPRGLSAGGFALGVAVAASVAWSRVMLHAHSPAEAIAGFGLGYPASLIGRRWLDRVCRPPRAVLVGSFALLASVGSTLLLQLPQVDLVRNVARRLTGHHETYERDALRVQEPARKAPPSRRSNVERGQTAGSFRIAAQGSPGSSPTAP